MTGSPFTPEQEARLREMARDEATSIGIVPFLFSVVALVAAIVVIAILVAQWIHA